MPNKSDGTPDRPLDLLEQQDRLRRQQAALLETQARFATQLESQAQVRKERAA